MRKLGLLIMAGQFAIAMGCSSNSNNAGGGTGGKASAAGGAAAMGGSGNVSSTTTGGGGAGGANAAGGTSGAAAGGATATATGGTSAGAGGSTSTSTCVIPSCLSKLFTAGCVGTGACVYQEVNGATNSENTCFSNGVKWIGDDDYSNDLKTVTVTHGGLTCYSMQYSGNDVLNAVDVLTVKDASGAVVATEAIDPVSYSGTIVTCTGGSPVELDPSCSGTPADLNTIMNMGQDCNTGSCSQ